MSSVVQLDDDSNDEAESITFQIPHHKPTRSLAHSYSKPLANAQNLSGICCSVLQISKDESTKVLEQKVATLRGMEV